MTSPRSLHTWLLKLLHQYWVTTLINYLMAPGFRNMKQRTNRQNEKVLLSALKTNIRNEIIEILSNVFDKSAD